MTLLEEEKYEYLRTFNEDLYVALGNSKVIDIFHPNSNDGKLLLKVSVKLEPSFLGVSIMSEGLNQYLIIFDSIKSQAISFVNMNCETMLKKEHEVKNVFKGNPILDIFYEAKHKFGSYKTYVVGCENPKPKFLNLHHCFTDVNTKSKVE